MNRILHEIGPGWRLVEAASHPVHPVLIAAAVINVISLYHLLDLTGPAFFLGLLFPALMMIPLACIALYFIQIAIGLWLVFLFFPKGLMLLLSALPLTAFLASQGDFALRISQDDGPLIWAIALYPAIIAGLWLIIVCIKLTLAER